MISKTVVFYTYVAVFVLLGVVGAHKYIADYNANNWMSITTEAATYIYCFPIVYGLIHMIPSFIAAGKNSERINLVYGVNLAQIVPSFIWFESYPLVGLHVFSIASLALGGFALLVAITSEKIDPSKAPSKGEKASEGISAADEIKKLSELKGKGILSEEEFTQQKQALLSSKI